MRVLHFVVSLDDRAKVTTIFGGDLGLTQGLGTTNRRNHYSARASTGRRSLTILAVVLSRLISPFTLIVTFQPTMTGVFALTLSLYTNVKGRGIVTRLVGRHNVNSRLVLVTRGTVHSRSTLVDLFND